MLGDIKYININVHQVGKVGSFRGLISSKAKLESLVGPRNPAVESSFAFVKINTSEQAT